VVIEHRPHVSMCLITGHIDPNNVQGGRVGHANCDMEDVPFAFVGHSLQRSSTQLGILFVH
jgi:hypothetical protein